jgi:hypothetical protein
MLGTELISIWNGAIRKSGQDSKISSLDENSNLADLCNDVWEQTIREMYTEYPWAFKKVRREAELQSIDPSVGPYTFAYPANSLRILGYYKDEYYSNFENSASVTSDINGIKIIQAPETVLYLEYILVNTNNDSIPTLIRSSLELKMGAEIARVKGKPYKELIQEYNYTMDKAKESDSTEDRKVIIQDDDYINCRG